MEFALRHQENQRRAKEDEEAKRAARESMRTGSPQQYRDLFDNGIVYRDSDLATGSTQEDDVTYL